MLSLTNARVVLEDRIVERGTVVIDGERIAEVREDGSTVGEVVDLGGCYLAPGFVDVHVHGGGGYDLMTGTVNSVLGCADHLVRYGVTSFLGTTTTASRQEVDAAIDAMVAATERQGRGARIRGIHIEGPYINCDRAGAQYWREIRPPDLDEAQSWLDRGRGLVKMMVLAPEMPGAFDLIKLLCEHGVTVALGHTDATLDVAQRAVELGASHGTHVFNAMRPLHHRDVGVLGCLLTDDRVWAELIADGVHVHPVTCDLVVRAKGVRRTLLVSDAIVAAGLGDGEYVFGGHRIIVREGTARIPAGNLAGSTLTLDRAVRNIIRFAHVSLPDAVRMASLTPAESVGLGEEIGSIAPGKLADLCVLDPETLEVKRTFVEGQPVFEAE